jgi:hypothetical protein
MNVGVELVGPAPRLIDLGLSLRGREASLLRRQILAAGAGSKLVGLGSTLVRLDLGDISQVSMLACLATQFLAMLGLAALYDVDHRDQDHKKDNNRGDKDGPHWQPPGWKKRKRVMRYQGPEQRSRRVSKRTAQSNAVLGTTTASAVTVPR